MSSLLLLNALRQNQSQRLKTKSLKWTVLGRRVKSNHLVHSRYKELHPSRPLIDRLMLQWCRGRDKQSWRGETCAVAPLPLESSVTSRCKCVYVCVFVCCWCSAVRRKRKMEERGKGTVEDIKPGRMLLCNYSHSYSTKKGEMELLMMQSYSSSAFRGYTDSFLLFLQSDKSSALQFFC